MFLNFLHLLFASAPPNGWIAVWAKRGRTMTTTWHRANALGAVEASAKALSASGFDVYYGVGLQRDELSSTQRGRAETVIGIPALWADFDMETPESSHAAKNLPKSMDEIAPYLEMCPIAPTMVVHSGGGLHVYWTFDRFFSFEPEGNRARAVHLQTKLSDFFAAHWAKRSWHWDGLKNMAQVLRLPETMNYKKDVALPVTLLYTEGPIHVVEAAEKAFASVSAVPVATPIAAPVTTSAKPIDNVAIWVRLGKLKNRANRGLVALLADKEPFAQPGERDQMLQKVASLFAYTFRPHELDIDKFLEIIGPSLEAVRQLGDEPSNPAPTVEDARRKFVRARADWQKDQDKNQRIKKVLTDSVPGGFESSDRREAPYSPEEIIKFAESQKCSPEDFEKRWVIQVGRNYYVFFEGAYLLPPFTKESLPVGLPQYLYRSPIEWYEDKLDKDGNVTGVKAKTMTQIIREYGSCGLKVVGDLSLQDSYYDPKTHIFHEAVCPLRKLEPVYDPQIDEWMTLFGGDESDKFKDWTATATNLSRQTSALYLAGVSGSGKTLFAFGMSRLFHAGGPTKLSFAMGSFNADIMRCPIIFADEHIGQVSKWMNVTAELRALIGSTSRTVNQKFRETSDIHGAVRVIIAANNDRLLATDEDLGKDDIEAIGSRFLYIKASQAAADYLASIGGASMIQEKWINKDGIAKHALWLRTNRQVADQGGRFLVKGTPKAMHRNLATTGTMNSLVTEWLVRFLLNPKPVRSSPSHLSSLIQVGNGLFRVSTHGLITFWANYIDISKTLPPTERVGRILKNLSVSTYRTPTRDYHEIDIEFIYEWAEKTGIGKRSELERVVQGVPPVLKLVPMPSEENKEEKKEEEILP